MTDQKRIRKQPSSKKQPEETAETPLVNQEQAAQVTEEAAAVRDAIDEILADFIPTEGPTEVIGDVSSVKRPSLRQASAEEFIRAFRQEEGQ